jgi:hypothetical protein
VAYPKGSVEVGRVAYEVQKRRVRAPKRQSGQLPQQERIGEGGEGERWGRGLSLDRPRRLPEGGAESGTKQGAKAAAPRNAHANSACQRGGGGGSMRKDSARVPGGLSRPRCPR